MKKKVWKVNGEKVFNGNQNYFDRPLDKSPEEQNIYFNKPLARSTPAMIKNDYSNATTCGSSIAYSMRKRYSGCGGGYSFSSCGGGSGCG